jgi:hypothetical protein
MIAVYLFIGFVAGFILACLFSASRIREAESLAAFWERSYKELLKNISDKILTRIKLERIGRL